ncbi:LEAF RUST 10 DISEASE-RESISTANCE LOCUS RECEPTOR-LIKE PROTEIN KINASE-like 1.2 isoform X2 [Rosa rugosa]|uniref:LEAF RUST 10 DISEASE-RESISTANCE LOCUS RECEPTOR-LIKE PROTEIN KINASE-like 1.2 isoform X2 n=1 Tax=Rosa rugosa TaxID=74645 RepID=UPI002B40E26C|nr:LEAF RUST 10 DISEASE-RESISTANCE LOCUS RECEPTOR-LIKE PROTEIN KINASE-like 1.2 isoform X2 [Rosa rugosa]
MSSPTSYLLIALLLLFFVNFHGSKANFLASTNCPIYSCDNELDFHYPFWKIEDSTAHQHCGYPGFGLTCSDSGEPILTLPKDSFIVKDINFTTSTITLVDIDVVNQTCPRARHTMSVGTLPLDYSPLDVNLSFYFNCTSFPDPVVPPITCLGSHGTKKSYVITEGEEPDGFDWSEYCAENVVVTVKKTEEITRSIGELVDAFGVAMNDGFVLNWTMAKECGSCETNGGFCGYKNTAPEILCFCKDGSIGTTSNGLCNKDSRFNWKLKVVVGLCSVIGTVAVMCFIFFIWRRRNRNRYGPSSYASRSIYSKSYSRSDTEKGSAYLGVHVFTYKELEQATNYFDSSREIGDGGFGTVYYGKVRDGRSVAVKRLYETNCKRVEQFMNEIEILARLRHQNLVLLYGCTSRHSRELLLVYEYVPNGTLADHLHGGKAKPSALPWHTRINIAVETASALSYLHASEIIHRDVKTTNILLDNNFCVKVADFGLSRLFPTDVTHISTAPQGTPGYVDPDYNQCYQLTAKSDVYSFGVVLVELISSLPAVDITRHRQEINLSNMAINKIQKHALHELVDPSLGYESDFKVRKMINAVAELAFRCLQNETDMRPSMVDVENELKRIQSDDFSKEKAEEIDISADDVVLLKSGPLPPSPDSVTINWVSKSSTPNDSTG